MKNNNLELTAKRSAKLMDDIVKAWRWYLKSPESGESMKIIISADIYDELQKYSKKINEPMSYIATIAIKKYLNL